MAPNMKSLINSKIKFREGFRPIAPSVIEEEVETYFDLSRPSPYMTIAADVKPNWIDKLPSITHVNSTARVQTVNHSVDPLYYNLIKETSFLLAILL